VHVLVAAHNGPTLEWVIRYKMVIGMAQGLQYLHEICHRPIIHGDVKASNILLGPDFEHQVEHKNWMASRALCTVELNIIVQTYSPFQFELCLPMNLSKSLCACLRTSCGFSGLAKWLPHNWTYHTVSPVEVGTTTRYPDYSTSLASSNMPPCLSRQTGRVQ
jgi:serine/threonine protein kinase